MNNSGVFKRITAALDAASIPYMLAGSFASSFYGANRSTLDIDFVIDATPQKLKLLVDRLPQDEYYVELDAALDAHKHESLFNILDNATGWKIDLIMLKSSAFGREEFRRRGAAVIYGVPLFIISVEDLILSKLEWSKLGGSYRQLEDVAGILKVRGESLDDAYLQKWIKELGLEKQWKESRQLAGISESL